MTSVMNQTNRVQQVMNHHRLQGATTENDFIVRGEGGEFVRMRFERKPRKFRNLSGGAFAEFRMSVQASADCGAADCQVIKASQSFFKAFNVSLQQARPAGHLLPYRQRRGVLQMRTADLNGVFELFGLRIDRVFYFADPRYQLVYLLCSCDVHRGREGVVRRL